MRLRQAQTQAGEIAPPYVYGSEALPHPYLAHVWAEKGVDLLDQAPDQARKMAMMGGLDGVTHELLAQVSPTKVSAGFLSLLKLLNWRHGPKLGGKRKSRGNAGQRSHPHQPRKQGGARRPALDHCRATVAVCPHAEPHQADMARPQVRRPRRRQGAQPGMPNAPSILQPKKNYLEGTI